MKKILLLSVLFIATQTFAQKGAWFLGGDLGFGLIDYKSQNGNDQNSMTASVSPEIGTFITNHFQFGFGVSYGFSKYENSGISRSITNSIGLNVFGRYLFGEKPFKPYLGLSIGAAPGQNKNTNLPSNITTTSDNMHLGAAFNFGCIYAINDRFSAIGTIGLISVSTDATGGTIRTNVNANLSSLGSRFTVGFYYIFKKPKE